MLGYGDSFRSQLRRIDDSHRGRLAYGAPMPSPHLERKLKEALGDEAGAEQAAVNDRIDSIRAAIADLRQEVVKGLHAVDKRIETVKSDLIGWSFVFWVGAVTAIAVLAGVLK